MIPTLYFQEEKKRLGMIKVYSDRFCWKKSKNDETLIVQMKMEDFSSASEPVIIITRTTVTTTTIIIWMMMMMMIIIMIITVKKFVLTFFYRSFYH